MYYLMPPRTPQCMVFELMTEQSAAERKVTSRLRPSGIFGSKDCVPLKTSRITALVRYLLESEIKP